MCELCFLTVLNECFDQRSGFSIDKGDREMLLGEKALGIHTGEAVFIFHPLIDPLSLEPTEMIQSLFSRKIASLLPSNGSISYSSHPRMKSDFFLASLL